MYLIVDSFVDIFLNVQEMIALGVGLGSVHANHHHRVTHHCGVSQVPTVVGVISGRVIHFHGKIRDSSTMQEFLERVLPPHVVLSVSVLVLVTEKN